MTDLTSQKAKMLAGEAYLANDPELYALHLQAQRILATFNSVLAGLFAQHGDDVQFGPGARSFALVSPFVRAQSLERVASSRGICQQTLLLLATLAESCESSEAVLPSRLEMGDEMVN